MKVIEKIFEIFVATILILLTLTVAAQILSRFLGHPLIWTEELSRGFLVYVSFLGGALAYYKGRGFKITLLSEKLGPKAEVLLNRLVLILSIGVVTFVVYSSIMFITQVNGSYTLIMNISKGLLVVAMPVGYFLILIRLIKDFKNASQVTL